MAHNTDNRQDYEGEHSSSWTSKLSKKLNRRSRGESNGEKIVGKQAERASPSSGNFARNDGFTEQSTTARHSTSTEQHRSRPGTSTSNAVYDSPSPTNKVRNPYSGSNDAYDGTTGAGPSNETSTISSRNQHVLSSGGNDVDDDFLGLDMKGRPRRRSDLSKQPATPERPVSSSATAASPSTRSSGSNPASRLFRRSLDRKSNDIPQSENAGNTRIEQSDTVRRKPVGGTSTMNRSSESGKEYSSLPIYSQFKDSQNHNRSAPQGNVNNSLNKASALLGNKSVSNQDADVDQLGTKVNRLALQSPELLTPASFASAQNYFEPKEGERCEDFPSQSHPTAQQIIDRAGNNTADTTTHERMLPAVTHETIQPQIHEITQEHLTRDIHHYHHVHRILPVHEVEVLPAKHFRIVNGVQVEMAPEQIPQSRVDAWESSIIPKV